MLPITITNHIAKSRMKEQWGDQENYYGYFKKIKLINNTVQFNKDVSVTKKTEKILPLIFCIYCRYHRKCSYAGKRP